MESLTNFLEENTKLMLSVKWLMDQKKHGDIRHLLMVVLDQFCQLSRFPEMTEKSQYYPEMAMKSHYCSIIVIEIVLALLGETRFSQTPGSNLST